MTQIQTRSSRKRKNGSKSKGQRKKSRQSPITHVKAEKVGRVGNFHYFGKTGNNQKEEKLEVSWMDKNSMGKSWRKNNLRGKRGQHLGTWTEIPIGSKKDDDIPSKNPCIAGTKY